MTITTASAHGLQVGDVIQFTGPRLERLRLLLTRPRLLFVCGVTETTLEIETRRMTWKEWRTSLWSVFR